MRVSSGNARDLGAPYAVQVSPGPVVVHHLRTGGMLRVYPLRDGTYLDIDPESMERTPGPVRGGAR